MNQTLETVSGKLVNIEHPDPASICIDDIAWGLSRLPRFCGHTITVIPFSVAQHSIFVADEVERLINAGTSNIVTETEYWNVLSVMQSARNDLILKALLHDAAEAYTGDLPSPVKRLPTLSPIFKRIESQLMDSILLALDVGPMHDDEIKIIKYADRIAQKIEAHAFMTSRGKHWENMPDVSLEQLQGFPSPVPALDAYKMFLNRFNQLKV